MTAEECIRCLPGYDPYRGADDYEFIPELAEEKIAWIENNCVHTEGKLAGEPYILAPHQRAIHYMLWGWRHKAHGYNRITEVFFYVPRKNSKTTDLAVVMSVILYCDPSPRMQLYSIGSGENQAALVYDMMAAMRRYNPEMEKRTRVYRVPRSIVRLADNSVYMPMPDNAKAQHGRNVRAAICDEIHTYDSDQQVVAMRTGMGTQQAPLLMFATTADYLRESFCNKEYDYAKKVLTGELDNPRYLPVIFEISNDKLKQDPDYWKKEAAWREANPLYGLSVQEDFMRRECQRAQDDPSYENEFKRLHLNIRTETSERMISSEAWDKCGGAFPAHHFDGKTPCAASLDLSSSNDTTSLCLLFDADDDGFDALWYHWLPRAAAVNYEHRYGRPFSVWEREGWITVTDGKEIRYDRVRADIERIAIKHGFKEINVDPLFQAKQICQQLEEDGHNVVYWRCTPVNMTAPTEELLRLINTGMIHHGNNPLMRDQAGNAVLCMRRELKYPGKAESTGHIDGIVTLIMSLSTALRKRAPGSVYERRGPYIFGLDDD